MANRINACTWAGVDGTLNHHNSNKAFPYVVVVSFRCSISSDRDHSTSAFAFTVGNKPIPCDFTMDMHLIDTSPGNLQLGSKTRTATSSS